MLNEYMIEVTVARAYPVLAKNRKDAENLVSRMENHGTVARIEAETKTECPTMFDRLSAHGFSVNGNSLSDIRAVLKDNGYIIRVEPDFGIWDKDAGILRGYHVNVQTPRGEQYSRNVRNDAEALRTILRFAALEEE